MVEIASAIVFATTSLVGKRYLPFYRPSRRKKVIDAYEEAFGIDKEKTNVSFQVLQEFGNMSSATVYVVLERFMAQPIPPGDYGLLVALGPGFSAEMILLKWE